MGPALFGFGLGFGVTQTLTQGGNPVSTPLGLETPNPNPEPPNPSSSYHMGSALAPVGRGLPTRAPYYASQCQTSQKRG